MGQKRDRHYREADVDEVDVSQLQRNLSLTEEQRIIEHQNALDLVFELEKAGERLREKPQ